MARRLSAADRSELGMREVAELIAALGWLQRVNASVRFESDKTVSIRVNNLRRRRTTFMEAVRSAQAAQSKYLPKAR
jgi:hypothetical protein